MRYFIIFLFSFFFLPFMVAQKQNALQVMSTSKSSKVSLLTCGPGQDAVTAYGHTAIRISDSKYGQDLVFNYGTYNFDTPGFLPKFIRGKLPYTLSASSMNGFLNNYSEEGRSVSENEFLLDSIQKKNFIDYVENNYRPGNREYMYDFFYDNCSNRIWEVLTNDSSSNYTLGENFKQLTFRDMIQQYQKEMPWTDFGIDIIIGSPADQLTSAKEQMFLPDYLKEQLQLAKVNDLPLLGPDNLLIEEKSPPIKKSLFSPWLVLLSLLILDLIMLFTKEKRFYKILDNIFFAILGFAGALLLFMWLGTDHQATYANYNMLWVSPLYLFLLFPFSRKLKKHVFSAIIFSSILSILGIVYVLPQPISLLSLPIIIMACCKYYRFCIESS